MSSTERVLSALNFLTGEGVNYYPDGCDGSAIEALITDYFNEGPDDDSDDESDHRNEGKKMQSHSKHYRVNILSGHQDSVIHNDHISEGTQLIIMNLTLRKKSIDIAPLPLADVDESCDDFTDEGI